MSIEIARYQFHSWSRKGISSGIADPDDLGAGTSTKDERAEVAVGVMLNGVAHSKNFLLIGPGDIVGVNSNMIVRTEPLNWITNFEPNYLSFVEFYDEDFAWRYTPAGPSGTKLRPWLALLLLKEDEFERTDRRVPLSSIQIKSKDVFPLVTETWLWAHMHSNADLPDSELNDYNKFLLSLNQTMNADPDQLYSRLICPRKLDPSTGYHAFLIPAFETGRLAGLQADPANTNAQMASWDANGAKGEMPVYFEWYFMTGVNEDFESLVNALVPGPTDPSVGIRDMDCSRPGFVRAEDTTQELPPTVPAILGLEGALKSPAASSTLFPDPPASNAFQVELEKIANLPVTLTGHTDSGDPIISIPIYGSNHAKQKADDVVSLDITKNNWVNDLNRDPRTRVPGGFGTTIVQNNQAYFLRKAWAQVDGIVQANKLIKSSVFMMKVALQFTVKTMSQFPQQVLLAVSKPVLSRVMGSPTTIHQQIQESPSPLSVFSGAFRRLVRPRGKFMRKLSVSKTFSYAELVTGINSGKLSAGPISIIPAGLPNTQDIAGQISNPNIPGWLSWITAHRLWMLIAMLVLALLLALTAGSWLISGLIVLAAVAGYFYLGRQQQSQTAAANLLDPQQELDRLPDLPPQSSFSLKLASEATAPPFTATTAGADSVEAANFRKALPDVDKRLALQPPVKARIPLVMENAYKKVSTAIHPHTSFPLRLAARIRFPHYVTLGQPDAIFPAMAYPDFEDPMYKYLCAISQELLMPNIQKVLPNTISLVQTNPAFIESYMVGLNYEMGRDLLWNEYPTDERGSYFRQFWDVKGVIEPSTTLTEAQMTEQYKDIKPIDSWPIDSLLGTHNNRMPSTDTVTPQAVLLIRGELLKRYPNTLIFAQKAVAGATADGPDIDLSLTDQTFPKEVKFPLYKADAPPDIKFFGFDLTIGQARGTEPSPGFTDNLGWFFIIQEVPGEPRFGMDIRFEPENPAAPQWSDLSWANFPDPGIAAITAAVHPSIGVPDGFRWGTDSANMAYILFRKPSMVAVHAADMLAGLP